MNNKVAITPKPGVAIETYDDPNRLIIPMPHWAIQYREVAAGATYLGKPVEISVPVNCVRRQVFAGLVNDVQNSTDFGDCLGEVIFYTGGKPELRLPFDYSPTTNFQKPIGFNINPSLSGTTPANSLGVNVRSTNNIAFLIPWRLRIACQKIGIEIQRGTNQGAAISYIVLGCLSEAEEV